MILVVALETDLHFVQINGITTYLSVGVVIQSRIHQSDRQEND